MRDSSMYYERCASSYALQRKPDARIAEAIDRALGPARTVVNVGAGTGSYEPADRMVVAIEPSAAMRSERPAHLPPAIDATAEDLPLEDGCVDAAMAISTIHHWSDPTAGLREMRRVSRGAVVILTFDIDALASYWMISDYVPEALADDRERFPTVDEVLDTLGGGVVEKIPVPRDCSDGFFEAHFAHPEAYLDPAVRAAQSVWPRLPAGVEQRAIDALRADLQSGAWDERHGEIRSMPAYEGALRLIVSNLR